MDLDSHAGLVWAQKLSVFERGWELATCWTLGEASSDSPTGVPLGRVSVPLSVQCVVVPDWEGKKAQNIQLNLNFKKPWDRSKREGRTSQSGRRNFYFLATPRTMGSAHTWEGLSPWWDLSPWGQTLASVRGPKPVPGSVMLPVPKPKGRGLELSLLLFSAWNTQWVSLVKPPLWGSDGWSLLFQRCLWNQV